MCVLLSTGYFSCQSQQELTVKKIRGGDAKHGQIHFINHNLLVCLRLATAITTFICFELVEKASFKLQLKSAVRESPLDFCTFLKVFQSYYRWLLFSRQTKTYTVPLVCSSFSRKKTYVTFNFHWEISLVVFVMKKYDKDKILDALKNVMLTFTYLPFSLCTFSTKARKKVFKYMRRHDRREIRNLFSCVNTSMMR